MAINHTTPYLHIETAPSINPISCIALPCIASTSHDLQQLHFHPAGRIIIIIKAGSAGTPDSGARSPLHKAALAEIHPSGASPSSIDLIFSCSRYITGNDQDSSVATDAAFVLLNSPYRCRPHCLSFDYSPPALQHLLAFSPSVASCAQRSTNPPHNTHW